MCGIAGYFLPGGSAQQPVIQRMCDVIRHRGPDDEGFHIDNGCAIGMRRLSIIDLSTGHQPIANEDQSVWIVFNGEIYEYRELRRRLIGQGHTFRTQSDTETILHLYEQEGPESLRHLRGMFAIAIWDARKRQLLLARDRFGKKPLYYALLPSGIYFGSELKCLQAAGVPLEIDPDALRLYFQFSYIPDPWSPYRTVKKLAAGSWLTYGASGAVRQGRYWSLPAPAEEPTAGDTPCAAQARVREAFDEAVRIRMIADVPLGAFLSGGIDSGSVVASMALQSKDPVKTFSIGFEEATHNELPYAALVARKYNTEHHEILVKPEAVSLVSRLVKHFDEPFGDSSAIPTFIVSEFAVQHVKVSLSGDGGDELFAGYPQFWGVEYDRRFNAIPLFARRAIDALASAVPYSTYGKNFMRFVSRPTPLERYFERNYAHYFLRKQLLQPDWMLPAEGAWLRKTMAHCLLPNGADVLSQAIFFEATSVLTGDMLVKVDRMSMANSLEVRSPLLDHNIAELAMAIPPQWNFGGGKGKRILIDALGDRLPPELLTRPKQGFGVPLAKWFRTSLHDFLWDHLTSERFLNRGMVSGAFVKTLLEEHDAGRRDNNYWLWGLLMLELWYREYETTTHLSV